jgi:hypothetical protein
VDMDITNFVFQSMCYVLLLNFKCALASVLNIPWNPMLTNKYEKSIGTEGSYDGDSDNTEYSMFK